ncbi:phage tail protein [Burkholderia ubonensis]|uniref:hypothetical protein n=1 Tax=Burkholderia ubonensis TaxID=101571 RepID=UPI0007528BA2|nr:hypothetical protein [Burkholderia ubonensis]KVR21728.1 phage tail protein [Burkholderia ubonensis]
MLVYFAVMVACMLLSAALQPKPQEPKPAAFSDFTLPQPDEGTPQCVVFGDCWSADWMVLWYGNYRTSEVKSSSGKK